MPSLKQIEKTMKELNIASEIIAQMGFDIDTRGNNPQVFIAVIDKMDELLTKEQCLAVMGEQGCCKGGYRDKECKAFGKKYKDKTLAEKIELLKSEGIQYIFPPVLKGGNTLSLTFGGHQNGVHKGKTTCSCGAIKKLKQPFTVSSTYCGCCAGHFLYHYQNALQVKLRLKEIISSPLNTAGEKPCGFLFEVIG